MKRTLCILFLGVVCGLAAHLGWLAYTGGGAANQNREEFGWMKAKLKLSDEQLQRIKALHDASTPRLRALAEQEEKMRDELSAFENERKAEGNVDFLAFARFVEKRRGLERECVQSTAKLVSESSEVMTPEQREEYLRLLELALGDAKGEKGPEAGLRRSE